MIKQSNVDQEHQHKLKHVGCVICYLNVFSMSEKGSVEILWFFGRNDGEDHVQNKAD